jgi:L-2-hydroxyglutarate oxidase LhgO
MTDKIPIAIIGGGALGLSVAYTLLQKGFQDIVLLEKNDGFGLEQSGSNSGVMHAGFLYPTGTDMARLCVEGVQLLYRFCQDHCIPHAQTGKLMVAINPEQEKELQKYSRLARDNGLEGVEILTPDETKKREPCLQVASALHVPQSGVFDASFYVSTLYKKAAGMHDTPDMLMKNCRVTGIEVKNDGFSLDVEQLHGRAGHWQLECKVLINAAGLYAWDIAKMISPDLPYEKQYLRGEYFQFNRGGHFLDLGAHLTPRVGPDERGNTRVAKEVLIGPIFTEVDDPQNYRSSIDRTVFYESVRPFLAALNEADLYRGHTGIIGLIKDQTDFMIMKDESHPSCIHLLGMESPALTASLAIGRHVANLID